MAILCAVVVTAFAQQPKPVEWHFAVAMTGKNVGEITATATIDKGWHLYGIDLPKGGPVATKWTFDGSVGVEFTGDITPVIAPESVVDPSWNMTLNWWEGKAQLKRKFRVTDPSNAAIDCKIKYMVCNGDNCLPPTTVKHRIVLKTAKK